VLAGRAREAGQVGSHCQPQPVSERPEGVGRYAGQFGEGHHALTLGERLLCTKLAESALDAEEGAQLTSGIQH
jgi:hypothetical protein